MLQACKLLWLQHTLCGLDVCLGCVVRHWYADYHIQGKQLVVEGALRLHIHLQPSACFQLSGYRTLSYYVFSVASTQCCKDKSPTHAAVPGSRLWLCAS